jgi:hypothetical protein
MRRRRIRAISTTRSEAKKQVESSELILLGIADTVTANVSTDFAALTGSTDEARLIGDAQKRNVISAKTERAELKRRGILGPDFREEDEEMRLAEEQLGLEPEQPMDPVTGNVYSTR